VSSFLTAHQHIIGYSVPYNGNDDDFYRSYDQTNSDMKYLLNRQREATIHWSPQNVSG